MQRVAEKVVRCGKKAVAAGCHTQLHIEWQQGILYRFVLKGTDDAAQHTRSLEGTHAGRPSPSLWSLQGSRLCCLFRTRADWAQQRKHRLAAQGQLGCSEAAAQADTVAFSAAGSTRLPKETERAFWRRALPLSRLPTVSTSSLTSSRGLPGTTVLYR